MAQSYQERLDLILAQYASGSLGPLYMKVVEAHLEMSDSSKGWIECVESTCGAYLDAIQPAELTDRDGMLAAIMGGDSVAEDIVVPREAAMVQGVKVPSALSGLVDECCEGVAWKSRLPGIKVCRVFEDGQKHATLYWMKKGTAVPSHTHGGLELTLVLSGSFSDGGIRYGRGDLAISDETVDHKPVVDADEDCICIAIVDAPLKLTGPIGRFISPFLPSN